jgi:O-antigen/teichoic acid export membrane protein
MNRKTKLILVIASVMFTLSLMIFGPHGSLNPTDIGFYTSIGAGVLWFLAMYFSFKKLIKLRSDKATPDSIK